jgi:hypothetical protein
MPASDGHAIPPQKRHVRNAGCAMSPLSKILNVACTATNILSNILNPYIKTAPSGV